MNIAVRLANYPDFEPADIESRAFRPCEERSDEAIQRAAIERLRTGQRRRGLLRFARNDGGVSRRRHPNLKPIGCLARYLLVAAGLLLASAACAKNTGVDEDRGLQSGPCYEALVDKNESNPTTAPKRELGAACQAEDGDIDKAWARIVRLWGSDSDALPDYDSYRRADAPVDGAAPKWVAAAGIVLTYLVLGWPMRSAARLFGAYPGVAKGAAAGAVVSLLLRGLVCAAFGALFGLPNVGAIASAALLAATLFQLARPVAAAPTPREGSFASQAAEAINDLVGALLPLAALGLFVQRNAALFAFAVLLAPLASTGPAIAARRVARATPLRAAIGGAALAAALGETLVAAPPVSGWLAALTGASVMAPLVLAAATLAAGWALAAPTRPARGDA